MALHLQTSPLQTNQINQLNPPPLFQLVITVPSYNRPQASLTNIPGDTSTSYFVGDGLSSHTINSLQNYSMLAIQMKLQNKSPMSKVLLGNPYLAEVRQHQVSIIRERGSKDSEDLIALARAPETIKFNPLL